MEKGVEERGPVAGRQDEPVSIRPVGVGRVMPEESIPEYVGHRSGPEGEPGMTGLRLFYRIDGEKTEGVDAGRIQVGHRSRSDPSGWVESGSTGPEGVVPADPLRELDPGPPGGS